MKLLQRLFPRKPKTEEEIAALIEGFANGAASRWDWIEGFANSTERDWAYFISTHFKNERVDWAQGECLKVELEFPHTGLVGWCNEQGLERLRAVASELRATVKKASQPSCPVCYVELSRDGICFDKFDCPRCGTTLKPSRRSSYYWVRTIVCFGSLIYAWKQGWESSFVIFVLRFYQMPALVLWVILKLRLFPPKTFEPVGSPVQTLGL